MQVTNTNKDTSLKWSKDGAAVTIEYDKSSGVSALTIPEVSKVILLYFQTGLGVM